MIKKLKNSLFIILFIIFLSNTLLTACSFNKPSASVQPEEELSVWDYTPDDLAIYLVQKGDIEYTGYTCFTKFASENRIYDHIELFWWDVDSLVEGSTEYKSWQEFKENEFYYFTFYGSTYVPQVNGPFAIKATDNYSGDVEKLYKDFAEFPKGYVKGSESGINKVDYSKTRDIVYTDFEKLALSYPNHSYDYVRNPIELPSEYCIRDDYMLYTQAQGAQGLCWDFSAALSLSTTLMKATGEYIDISESWINAALRHDVVNSLLPNYTRNMNADYNIGDAGGFLGFDLVANYNGIVLEQDFEFDDSFLMGNENADSFYDFYEHYSNKNIMKKVIAVRFDDYSIAYNSGKRSDVVINSMKSHILNHGSITSWTNSQANKVITYNGHNVTYKEPSEVGSDHVISIIGWDDNFSVVDAKGRTRKGAWIVLNSWDNSAHDNDGIFYILYNDDNFSLGGHMWGYVYRDDIVSDGLYFTDKVVSGGEFITDKLGAYYGDFISRNGETKQKNIFYNIPADLTYEYVLSEGAEIDDIQIFRDGNNVTEEFIVTHNALADTFNIKSNYFNPGEYKVEVSYSDKLSSDTYYNSFYMVSGTEICNLALQTKEVDNEIVNNGNLQLSFRYGNDEEYVSYYTTKVSGEITYYICFNTYNKIVSAKTSENDNNFTTVFGSSCAWVTIKYDTSEKNIYPVTFLTKDGTEKVINFYIVSANKEDTLAYVWYENNGGSDFNSDKMLIRKNLPAQISAPTRNGFIFEGWYYDENFTNALNFDGEKYLIDYSALEIKENLTSYFKDTFNYYYGKYVGVRLYAKWSKNE